MKNILRHASWLAFLFLLTVMGRADDSARKERPTENRFLFIVDNSSAMRPYANVVEQSIVELLNSDMKGELRQGDTIGLWTYNDKLHSEFPMQTWSKRAKNTIVSDVADFLRGLSYEKRGHIDKVLPPMQQVIKSSQKVTIIFVFDGSGMIRGTPFDADINELQKQYAHELRAAEVPFVTVLAARNGAVFDYTINYPNLVVIPHTAEPEPPAVTNAPVAVQATPAPAPKPRRKIEIVMSGSSHPAPVVPIPAPAPAPKVVEAPKPTPSPTPVVVETPKPAPVVAPIATPTPVAPVVVEPAVVTNQPTNIAALPEMPAPLPEVHQVPPASTVAVPAPPPVSPGMSSSTQLALFIMAFSLLIIAAVLVVFLVRRFRGGPQPSLISQSMDRPR
jgi:hypothetical protein